MGRKRTGPGKCIYICLTGIILSMISGCAAPSRRTDTMTTNNVEVHWRPLVPEDLRDNQRPLPPANRADGDEMLFNTGLDYANPANPKKDYNKSLSAFRQIAKDYPKSPWANPSNILVDVIQENIRLRRLRTEALQENAKLQKQATEALQENERLKDVIEQSKKVDIEIEEKKREKAR